MRVALPLVALVLLSPTAALAHDEPGGSGKDATAAQPQASPPSDGAEPSRGERAEEAREPNWETALDFVGGATTLDVLTGGRPTRIESPPVNTFDSMRVTTWTAVVGLERHLGERLTVGARIPILDGELRSRTGQSDPATELVLGNLELEGAYVLAKGATWSLDGALEVGVPIGGGAEPPTRSEVAAEPDKTYDYARIARFSTMRAASFSRGSYETILFESGRLGLAPKLAASFRFGDFTLRPMVKVENLLDVTGDATESYIGELVAGARGSYRVARYFEPGLHVWTNVTFTKHEELNTDTLFVEPFVRFPVDNVSLSASFMAPVVGSLLDEKTFGIRVGLSVEF
jgi:hypothetical protein